MSIWDNKTIPFWQEILAFPSSIPILISEGKDYRAEWPESFQPSMSKILNELAKSRISYIKLKKQSNRISINILSGKIVVSCTLSLEKNKVFLNNNKGLTFATNIKKTTFVKYGIRIKHNGILILSGRDYNQKYTENDDLKLLNNIKNLANKISEMNTKTVILNENLATNENTFTESESSKIEEVLETLEIYINKEYEIEDTKARAEKPFVYTDFKAEDIVSSYKYYYRITLLQDDVKRLRELNPSMLQIKKADETFMPLEVFNIKPNKSFNDIIVTTSIQTDSSMIDNSNELYLVAIPTLQKVRQRVIDDLRRKASPNKWLIPLVAGVYSFEKTIKVLVPEYNEKYPLLPAQRDGVEKGVGSKDITLILGPPGTGKTTVILSWVKFFVSKGMKVLVTSQNNKAVDNVLERLAKEEDLECLRVGNESKVSSSIHNLLIENYALNAQSKLIDTLSNVLDSLNSSKIYLDMFDMALKEIVIFSKKEKEYHIKINDYKINISNQNQKIHDMKTMMSNLKANDDFLEKFINSFTTEELCLKKEQESIVSEQINKNTLKLYRFKQQLSKLKQKVDNYSLKSTFFKVFMYLANRMNTLQINRLKRNIDLLEITIITSKQKIEVQIIELNELLNQSNDYLNELKTQLKESNNNYLKLIKLKPKIPKFIPCDYINDNNYKNFDQNDEFSSEFMNQIKIDLSFYSSLIKIISEWKRSMSNERQSSLYETIIEYVDVVGATCIGINSNRLFADIPFDVVIVDESGQIQLHNLMVPLSRASKAILVGDHKQLPPVVDTELAEELEEQGFDPIFLQKSWFEILWNSMPEDHKTMLDTQFRCPAIISDFISKVFYDNKYFAGNGMKNNQPILSYYNSTMAFIDTSKIFPSFEQSRISDGRTEVLGNEVETKIIIETLMKFIKELPYLATESEIGIIIPYKNHVIEVKRKIREEKLDIGNLNVEDLVASVDSYQGQERDVIIFAFTRSNKRGNIGFLADWRRLNVAMTRTKKQLIMVGSLKTLTLKNKKEQDTEFKQAMKILEEELRAKDSIIDGRQFINGAR